MKLKLITAAILSTTLLSGCGGSSSGSSSNDPQNGNQQDAALTHNQANMQKVLDTNADIAYAAYSDSVDTAQALLDALIEFRKNPTSENLAAAKAAWLVAREPYGQTEVYRFRLSPIDSTDYANEDGPEGDINAWPLGEALIDYTVSGNDFNNDQLGVTANEVPINGGGAVVQEDNNNIINNTSIVIDNTLLSRTMTAEDERDVIAGYHAIEFLLWGQDLNNEASADTVGTRDQAVKTHDADNIATGTGHGSGGFRSITDFADYDMGTHTLSGGFASDAEYDSTNLKHRRLKYLEVAAQKLVGDLTAVRDGWAVGAPYRTAFTSINNINEGKTKFYEILYAMGTMAQGELAGERMQIALSADSQEDEHSCFSDNTHRDFWLNAEGIANVYYGDYAGYDSTLDGEDDNTNRAVTGYGLDDYLTDAGSTAGNTLEMALATTKAKYEAIDTNARAGYPVDVVIMDKTSERAKPIADMIYALTEEAFGVQDILEAMEIDGDAWDPEGTACDTTDPTAECE